MMATLSTLLLDTVAWDLVLDSNGNIALAAPPYAMAQDVASALMTFLGECWYNTSLGVPYWQQLLGFSPSKTQWETALNAAAMTVPGVVSAATIITGFADRHLSGQVQFTTSDGNTATVLF
jgi:hypothetical protein